MALTIALKSVNYKAQLTDAIEKAHGVAQLNRNAAASIASTALMLAELQTWSNEISPHSLFCPDQLILLPPGAGHPSNQRVGNFIRELVLSAEEAASSQACSSILAGQSSESDDTGDIGLWLGDASSHFSNAQEVLGLFGLEQWANSGNIVNGKLPAMIDIPEIASLDLAFSFHVSSPSTGGITAFFYVGRYENEWVGLLGMGTLQ